MYKIIQKMRIGLFVLIVLTYCDLKVEAQLNKTYEIIGEVAKQSTHKLNREVMLDRGLITKYLTLSNFQFSIYNGMEKVSSQNDFSAQDIKELKIKVNFSNYPTKWKKSFLRKVDVKLTTKKIGNKSNKPLYKVSPPIFFKNDTFVLIYIRIWCGLECGDESLKIFKVLENSTYEYYGEILIGIS